MFRTQQWAGAAEGFLAVQQDMQDQPRREARLAEARSSRKLADAKLNEYTQQAPLRESKAELELAQTRGELRTTQAENLKNSTYNAFRLYEADGGIRHLNTFLTTAKQNPAGKSTWGHWVRFDPVVRNAETEAMLGQSGIVDIDEFFNDPELVKSKVLGVDQQGQQTLLDMNKLYQGTGFTQYMTAEELKTQQSRAQVENLMRGTQSAETNLIAKIREDEPTLTWREATEKYYAAKNQGKGGSQAERLANEFMAKDPNLTTEQALEKATRAVEKRTSVQKNLEQAQATRATIDEAVGGSFFDADMSDPAVRRAVGPSIVELQKLTGTELSTEDKRVVRDLRSLTSVGGKAGEGITDAEAGPIDSLIRGFKKYVSNEIPGTEGVAAYETFRNIFRNALYGASLSKHEIETFTAAAGSMKQQTGPVLQQLLVQMGDVKQQLESVYLMNDEYIAQYYLGTSLEDIDMAVEALEERVDFFKNYEVKQDEVDKMVVPAARQEKPSLDSIFGAPK